MYLDTYVENVLGHFSMKWYPIKGRRDFTQMSKKRLLRREKALKKKADSARKQKLADRRQNDPRPSLNRKRVPKQVPKQENGARKGNLVMMPRAMEQSEPRR